LWLIALLAPAFIVSPGLIQKAFGARDARAARTGIALNAAALMLFAFAPVLLGMMARVTMPGIENSNSVLPSLLTHQLPPWLGAIALAAVFSTEVDTCDAILFMLSTSASKDVYKRFLSPQASDAQLLKVGRLTALGGGIIGVLLAMCLDTVIGALTIFYQLLVVTLFVPIIGGLYVRRATGPAALAAITGGVATLFVLRIGLFGSMAAGLDPTLCAIGVAAAAFAAVTAAGSGRSRE
jgi:SSS family solute:Na+ symporter